MDPAIKCSKESHFRLPRARGDGPWLDKTIGAFFPASPRTRGWTPSREFGNDTADGFPAHAGMDPYFIRDTIN